MAKKAVSGRDLFVNEYMMNISNQVAIFYL